MRNFIEDFKNEVNLVRALIFLLIIAVVIHLFTITWGLLGNFSDIILILIFAWILSFLLEPLVLETARITRLSKSLSTIIIYILLFTLSIALIFLFIPEVTSQIQTLVTIIPQFVDPNSQFINQRIENTVTTLLNTLVAAIPSIAQFFFQFSMVLILSFYFIVDKENIQKELLELVPQKWHKQLIFIQQLIEDTFASFLRVQLFFGIVMGIVTWIILTLLQVEFAASSSFLAAILTFIPMIGPLLGSIPPIFVAFLSTPIKALIVAILIAIAQQIVYNAIGTKMLGKAYKIHPAIILISFLIGMKIGGSMGAIFAIPILGVLSVVARELSHYFLKNR